MSSARYAIYLAPPPDTPLWRFGSRVLGYDAVTGKEVAGFAPDGLDPAIWQILTDRPRTYGFHATLKAPFHLSENTPLLSLETELRAFSRTHPPFDLGPLAVRAITQGSKGFVALVPLRDTPELGLLEQRVVHDFDRFRAPLTEDDIHKRNPGTLTLRQRESLLSLGYPYVGPDYRFHMTLSGVVPDAAEVADTLADTMANDIGTAHLMVDAVVLFRQGSPSERFRVVCRFDLMGVSS
jgi:2'-5' RNA ligase